jgi:hypothetical protein
MFNWLKSTWVLSIRIIDLGSVAINWYWFKWLGPYQVTDKWH